MTSMPIRQNDDVVPSLPSKPGPGRVRSAFFVLALVQATLIFTIALIMVPLPHIGREFAVGLAIFGAASLVAAFSPGFEVPVGMRFLQGLGGALTAPAAMAVLRMPRTLPARHGRLKGARRQ